MEHVNFGDLVTCNAYLKPVHDGVFIEHIDAKLTVENEDVFVLHSGVACDDKEEVSTCEGAYDLEKTYYERKEKKFSGIVVGVKDVVTEGYLGVDTDTPSWGGERRRIFKAPKTTIKCARVYYALGKSRLVPIEDVNIDTDKFIFDKKKDSVGMVWVHEQVCV